MEGQDRTSSDTIKRPTLTEQLSKRIERAARITKAPTLEPGGTGLLSEFPHAAFSDFLIAVVALEPLDQELAAPHVTRPTW